MKRGARDLRSWLAGPSRTTRGGVGAWIVILLAVPPVTVLVVEHRLNAQALDISAIVAVVALASQGLWRYAAGRCRL